MIGLDIGSFTVKAVQLHKSSSGWTVTAAGIANIFRPDKDQADVEVMAKPQAIDECLRVCDSSTNLAVCGVGGPEVAVRYFEFASTAPVDRNADLDEAVRTAATQVCPSASDGIAVDYRLTSNGNGRTTGYWVAATNELVRNTVQVVEEAGLNCVLIDADGLALINCFSQLCGSPHGVAILNVGNSHTTLAVEGSNDRPFIRHLSCGGNTIIDTLARETDVPADTLRGSLLNWDEDGPCGVPCSSAVYGAGFEKACSEFAVDVGSTLGYCRTLEPSFDVQEILVCGDFASVSGFVNQLNKQLSMKVSLWNPFKKMRCGVSRGRRGAVSKMSIRRNGPAMAVAAGLAMRSV
ncbi:MAG: pilus assembly protein PilM [Phycisphaerales bacterium]|nr:MAG: pilus assembly protein PilM [Phycisphaerales bacterium]